MTLLRKKILDDSRKYLKYEHNIKWVLTVPPLLDKKGHKFMRDIAYKVGMNNIDIALEPEASSLAIFEQFEKYKDNKEIKEKNITLNKGDSFVLVDAGGYTVDFGAYKILDDNKNLEQLIYPKSIVNGSIIINEGIIKIIEDIYGKEVIQNAIINEYDNWESTLQEIEQEKINLDKTESNDENRNIKITIKFKVNLKDDLTKRHNCDQKCCLKFFNCKIIECKTDNNIVYKTSEIFIPEKVFTEIINKLAEDISKKISFIFLQLRKEKPEVIVLTGGFSQCKKLVEKIKEINNKEEIYPEYFFLPNPQETVAKGAAIYGVRPSQILKVRCPFTVAIETYYFSDNDNCDSLIEQKKNKFLCSKNLTIARRQESMKVNETITNEIIPSSEKIKIFFMEKNAVEEIELEDEKLFLNHTKIPVSMKFSNYIRISIGNQEEKIIYYQ